MKYCLLSTSYMLAMLLCANQLTAQEKIVPKAQPTFTQPERGKLSVVPNLPDTNLIGILGEFDQTPLPEMLGQVSKWYKVKVDYNSIPADIKVCATLSKSLGLPELLQALNKMNHTNLILKDSTISNQLTDLGVFFFDRTPLKKALHQVSKWYKVKVNYKHMPNAKVSGTLQKNLPLPLMIEYLNIMSGAKLTLTHNMISNQP